MRTKGKLKESGQYLVAESTGEQIAEVFAVEGDRGKRYHSGESDKNSTHLKDSWNLVEALGGDAGVVLLRWNEMADALRDVLEVEAHRHERAYPAAYVAAMDVAKRVLDKVRP